MKTLRFSGLLLAGVVLAQSLAFAGVNRWTTSGPFGVYVPSLAVDPTNSDSVYAGTSLGVFHSAGGGLSWTTTSLSASTASLTIDPSDSSIVYAATQSGVFRSVDAGGSWTSVGRLLTMRLPIQWQLTH